MQRGVGEGVVGGGRIGDDDDAESGGGGGLVAGHGVLEGDGFGGVQLDFGERGEVEIGRGFAAGNVFAAKDGLEFIQQAACGQMGVHVAMGRVGGNR